MKAECGTLNVERRTLNIERRTLNAADRAQQPTSNIQRRTLNAERRTSKAELGRTEHRRRVTNTSVKNQVSESPAEYYDLEQRLLQFGARVIRLSESVTRSPAGQHIALQVVRSGTSPLGNHGEAQAAESAADFVHKMKVCLKELRETQRWLRLIEQVPLVKSPSLMEPLLQETDELIRIFVVSIRTSQQKCARTKNKPTQTP